LDGAATREAGAAWVPAWWAKGRGRNRVNEATAYGTSFQIKNAVKRSTLSRKAHATTACPYACSRVMAASITIYNYSVYLLLQTPATTRAGAAAGSRRQPAGSRAACGTTFHIRNAVKESLLSRMSASRYCLPVCLCQSYSSQRYLL
jgi:hypothetical protein